MNKLKQSAVTRFFDLKGLRPQQIQTELSDTYHEQAFELLAVEKWHFRFADRTRDLEDESRSEQPTKIDSWPQLQNCSVRIHLPHAR
jgi:hypothetical protein